MKSFPRLTSFMTASSALALAVLLAPTAARANIYATDIKINGGLTNAPAVSGTPVSISYRLNEGDATGVTVKILQGSTTVATLIGGTNFGLNTVSWTPASGGSYSVAITAAAAGFPYWTQTSVDTNPGNYAFYPKGFAVNKNPNSPYYGRVYVACTTEGTPTTGPEAGVFQYDGIYKNNADGSFADEGAYGNGGYTSDDAGDPSVLPNEMPSASGVVPYQLRVGADDRVYMLDWSGVGAVIAFDPLISTNQIAIDDGGADGGQLGGPNNYAECPGFADLSNGINRFDVTGGGTTNSAIWLGDDDYPGWGVWMFHMTNGVSDPNDTVGILAVQDSGGPGAGGTDYSLLIADGGLMVDTNLDIFVSTLRYNPNAIPTMDFTNFNGGMLPPESTSADSLGSQAYADGTTNILWGTSATDPADTGVRDTVIDSRANPKYVATPMYDTASESVIPNSGIRVLYTANGNVVSVTNGATVQVLTNIDFGNYYTSADWDNVGNLYGASTTANVWRVWSPPGANTNTTVAVPQIVVSGGSAPGTVTVTGITAKPTALGVLTVTIKFTATGSPLPTAFTLLGSSTVGGTYAPVVGALITGSAGSYQAVAVATGNTAFYKIEE